MPSRIGLRALACAAGALVVAPALAAAAERPTAAQLDTTQQIAQAALRKVALLEASLEGKPAPDPAFAGRGGIVRVTAGQLRTNQRIAQAAIRRAAALEARLAGRPAPTVRPGKRDVIRLTARQAAITRRIAVAAMRRANALAGRIPYWHPAVEIEMPGFVKVRSTDLHDAGHAAVGMLVGEGPAAAVRHGSLGRWRTGMLASASGDRTVGFGPIVRVNVRGAALAVWSTSGGEIVAARREPGGRWSVGAPVGLPGLSALALGDDGTARAIGDGGKVRTQAGPGASWTAPASEPVIPGVIALDRTGRAVAAWAVAGDGPPETRSSQVFSATLGPSGWSTPAPVARTEDGTVAGEVAVALGQNGDAAMAWELYRASAPLEGGLQAASRPAGGGWGAPVEVKPRGTRALEPSVAVGDTGATVVAWRELGLANSSAASRPAGAAAFGPPAVLFAAVPDASVLDVEATAHATGDRPAVLLDLGRHGATVDWATAEPGGRVVRVPDWGAGLDGAAAVAAGGGILAAGPDDEAQRTLHIESRGPD